MSRAALNNQAKTSFKIINLVAVDGQFATLQENNGGVISGLTIRRIVMSVVLVIVIAGLLLVGWNRYQQSRMSQALQRADQLYLEKKYADAILLYTQVDQTTLTRDQLYNLAESYRLTNRSAEAGSTYSAFLTRPDTNEEQNEQSESVFLTSAVVPYQEQAIVLAEDGKLTEAFEYLTQSQQSHPDLAIDLSLVMAQLAEQHRDYVRMQAAYESVRKTAPQRLPISQRGFADVASEASE